MVLAALAYTVVFSILTIARYRAFHGALYDLGAIEQSLWNTLHGHPFQNTIDEISANYLGNHFSPGIALLLVPYAVVPRAETLLVVQSALLAAAAVPIYFLARDWTRSPALAAAIGCAYLLYPATHGANVFDVHETALVPFAVACTLLFLHRRPGGPAFWVCFALTLLAKDEMVVFGFALAVYIAIARRRWRLAAAVAGVCALWATLVFGVFMPLVGDRAALAARFRDRYRAVGGSVGGIVHVAWRHPSHIVRTLTAADKVSYYGRLLVPFGFVPLAGGWLVAVAAAVAGVQALSNYAPQYDVSFHYSAAAGPLVALATAAALGRLSSRTRRPIPIANALAAAGVLCAAVTSTLAFGMPSGERSFGRERFTVDGYARTAAHFVSLVPDGASLSADNNLGGHFSRRRALYPFPAVRGADYVLATTLAERISLSNPLQNRQYAHALRRLMSGSRYVVAHEENGIVLLRRTDVPTTFAPPSRPPLTSKPVVAAVAALLAAAAVAAVESVLGLAVLVPVRRRRALHRVAVPAPTVVAGG